MCIYMVYNYLQKQKPALDAGFTWFFTGLLEQTKGFFGVFADNSFDGVVFCG